ncbi:Lrp/AsnC family transcriptional regulator [Yinghuangia soli]|uniref:Lrp/AsnC family transcriptional regulator n=1 Tax=Yinghuangia soli TaxID=2908204 RepID=A0AA41TZW6_9ACTN|nr:Lrp/AsnC family transcriptional regulator [Yinghuangia soli]MCF2527941.1 Lrp/AsnC family transcriptional regulator [Yinghuangia soli]
MQTSRTAYAADGDIDRSAGADADELDLVLINALQLRPRATWTELAPVLRVDAVTLARRWRRLVRDGCAWVTCYPRPGHIGDANGGLALVEIDVRRGALDEVAARLADDPYAVSVERMTGGRDLLVSLMTSRVEILLDYVQRRFTAIPGITATRTHLVTHMYAEGSGWRLRSLDAAQRAALGPPAPRSRPAPGGLGPADPDLIVALGEDGRASHTELAAHTGSSTTTVARRLQRLVAADLIRLRCEVAQPLSGWPIRATLWLRVPPAALDATARQLAAHPGVRMCAGVAGSANLMLVAWLRHVADVPRLEVELLERFGDIAVMDRAVTLRMVKQMGRILDDRGRAVRHVPMDLWDFPAARRAR